MTIKKDKNRNCNQNQEAPIGQSGTILTSSYGPLGKQEVSSFVRQEASENCRDFHKEPLNPDKSLNQEKKISWSRRNFPINPTKKNRQVIRTHLSIICNV